MFFYKSMFVFLFNVLFLNYALLAQGNGNYKPNWQNLDLQNDSIFGCSINKAYQDLLSNKKHVPIVIAVIDGGIDINHEALTDSFWTNPGEIPNNGLDDDLNGYVDDIHGWNFLGSSKGSFIYDNIDLVRMLRKEISDNPKSHNVRELQSKLDDIRRSLIESRSRLTTERQALHRIIKNVKSITDDKELRNYIYTTDVEESMLLKLVSQSSSIIEFIRQFEENFKTLNEQIDYWTNINYNPRNSEYNQKRYGNNDVKALLPKHGTHVSGIIAGKGDIVGVFKDAKIMCLRAIPEGEFVDRDLANAINYAVDNGAKIINLSVSKSTSTDRKLVENSIKYAMNKDVLIVHAAGNNGAELHKDSYFPNRRFGSGDEAKAWIEVGASDQLLNQNLLAGFSNYSSNFVDIFAPGVNIKSTWFPEKYFTLSGTSMASPIVSGIAALLRSYFPNLTALQVKKIILESASKVNIKVRRNDGVLVDFSSLCKSGGIINAYEAVLKAQQLK